MKWKKTSCIFFTASLYFNLLVFFLASLCALGLSVSSEISMNLNGVAKNVGLDVPSIKSPPDLSPLKKTLKKTEKISPGFMKRSSDSGSEPFPTQ